MRTRKPLIYIAGPYTHGDVISNVQTAIACAEDLVWEGVIPYVPHLNMLWDLCSKHNYEFWLAYDFEILDRCDGLLLLPGHSPGAAREVRRARRKKIPVFKTIANLRKWVKNGSSNLNNHHSR